MSLPAVLPQDTAAPGAAGFRPRRGNPSVAALRRRGYLCAMQRILGAALLTLAPAIAGAHPHIFVDTGLRLIHDAEGRVAAIEVRWTYDELFSLLLLEDLGLDADYDGVLTEAEESDLQGFDLEWPDGFEGDVYAYSDGEAVPLGPPQPGLSGLQPNGMLTSTHIRPLLIPLDPEETTVSVKVYDPTFYTAYTILSSAASSDRPGCEVAVFEPDLDGAYALLAAALAEVGADVADPFEELDFPPVGDRFSDELRVTCGAGG